MSTASGAPSSQNIVLGLEQVDEENDPRYNETLSLATISACCNYSYRAWTGGYVRRRERERLSRFIHNIILLNNTVTVIRDGLALSGRKVTCDSSCFFNKCFCFLLIFNIIATGFTVTIIRAERNPSSNE